VHVGQVASLRINQKLWLLMLGLCVALFSASPRAEGFDSGVDAASKPLVLIRFNQRSVYYEKQLYMAVSRAVEVKPSVMFEIVSHVPDSSKQENAIAWKKLSAAHVSQVIASLNRMGVPASRISFNAQSQPGLKFDEVHIFAR